MVGLIHSIETFGTVDGPSIRLVVFTKGCPMRCLYCHNPDTWSSDNAKLMSAEEILDLYDRNKAYYQGGGITVSGGEPLMQIDFLIDLLKKAKEKDIHTCVDTSGVLFNKIAKEKMDELIKYVDLFLLDIKQIDNEKHIKLTNHSNVNILAFAEYLSENKIATTIRHVIVKGYSDDKQDLSELGRFIGKLKSVKSLEVLPYHDLAKDKYKQLNIDYVLKDVPVTSKQEAIEAKKHILAGIVSIRKKVCG